MRLPIHLSRARVPLEEYKERLLEAGRIYEHTMARRTAQEVSAVYMGAVPYPFGSQMPPPSPNPSIQKITGPTRVSVCEAFKDFLKTHLSESSEEEMMQM